MIEWAIISICSLNKISKHHRILSHSLVEHICFVMWLVVVVVVAAVVVGICRFIHYDCDCDDYYRRHLWSCARVRLASKYINISLVLFVAQVLLSFVVVVVARSLLFVFIHLPFCWLFASIYLSLSFSSHNSESVRGIASRQYHIVRHSYIYFLKWRLSTLFIVCTSLFCSSSSF